MSGATILGNMSTGPLHGPRTREWIAESLRQFLSQVRYECGQIDVRSPEEHPQAYADIYAQHPDGWHNETECVGRFFVVWSDIVPTEIMMDDGRIFKATDGDVILIDNLHARHRPPNVARWFARAWHVREIVCH